MPSEVEQIEAILREHIRCDATGLASVRLQGIPEAAAAIAALRAQDREDGAREIVLPPGWVAIPRNPTKSMKSALARAVGGNCDIGHDAFARAIAAAPTLPLASARTEDGDA